MRLKLGCHAESESVGKRKGSIQVMSPAECESKELLESNKQATNALISSILGFKMTKKKKKLRKIIKRKIKPKRYS